MKKIKTLEGHRWFIWAVVFIFVSLIALSVYIVYVSNYDSNNVVGDMVSYNKAKQLIVFGNISYIVKKTPNVSYVQLTSGASTAVIKQVNDQLKSVLDGSCFDDPSDPNSTLDLQNTYNDQAESEQEEGLLDQPAATKEEVFKMSYQEVKQRLIKDFSFESKINEQVLYAKNNFLSVSISFDENCGGVHPNYGQYAYNFDLNTGRDVRFVDIFKNYKKDKDAISKIIIDYVEQGTNEGCDYGPTALNSYSQFGKGYGGDLEYGISGQSLIPLSFGFSHAEAVCEPNNASVLLSDLAKYLRPDNLFLN